MFNWLTDNFWHAVDSLQTYNGAVTAFATIWIAAFTIVLAIVGGRQARLTRASVAIARSALTEIERAFIYLDGFETEITTGEDVKGFSEEDLPQMYRGQRELFITRFAVAPRWKNSGNTPPRNLTIKVNWCGATGDVTLYEYRSDPTPFFVGPNAMQTSTSFEIPSARAVVDWSWHPVGDQPLVLVWGRADYDDIFDRHHFTEWCYRVTFVRPFRGFRIRAVLTQWGEYNRTDNSQNDG